jgi:uncharacterized protein (TIGR00251 family)
MKKMGNIIKKNKEGVTINLYVTTDAKKCIFPADFNKWREKIEIKVNSKPKDNKANFEVIKLVADFFQKPMKNIMIIRGKKTKEKTVLIKDIDINTVVEKLKELVNGL